MNYSWVKVLAAEHLVKNRPARPEARLEEPRAMPVA